MTRRLLANALLIGTLGSPAALAGQRDFSAVEIRTEQLSSNLYVLFGQGGNIGLSVGKDGAFIVDDQFAPLTERIKAAIAAVTDLPVEFVLNTHWHGDHTGGNENLGGEGAMIIAHDNVYKRLNPREFADLVGQSRQASEVALPVVTFSETMTFHWNDEDIHVFHVSHAHTDGDGIVHFRGQNVFHMGDTFFNGFYPFIDLDSGGDVDGMIRAAEAVLAVTNSDTRIIPGHGPLAGPDRLRAYRLMLMTVRDRVRTMRNDGMSEDEVVSASPTSEFDAEWGSRGDEWSTSFVRSVYRSVGSS